jgi:hypothetical protein
VYKRLDIRCRGKAFPPLRLWNRRAGIFKIADRRPKCDTRYIEAAVQIVGERRRSLTPSGGPITASTRCCNGQAQMVLTS